MKRLVMGLAAGLCACAAVAAEPAAFREVEGKTLDVLLGGKTVARYMHAYDMANKDTRHETYKPYLHVFDAAGEKPITKGPGGDFTHHRGIFIGWNKISFDGKNFDRWHMNNGEQVHQKFAEQKCADGAATFTSVVNWNDDKKEPIIVENRTMSFKKIGDGVLQIDFTSALSAPRGDVKLSGDPEHAGVQFRPANEVDRKATTYCYAGENIDPHKATDMAWVGETFKLNDKTYSVVQINHPGNPQKTRISAYRNYGRFGMFPVAEIKKGDTLTLRYRFLCREGDMLSPEAIQANANTFTGKSDAVPPVTRKKAE